MGPERGVVFQLGFREGFWKKRVLEMGLGIALRHMVWGRWGEDREQHEMVEEQEIPGSVQMRSSS